MPLVTVYTSAPAPDEARGSALLLQLSGLLAKQLRKPESYVMTCLVPQTRMTFAGTEDPACYVEVKSIGNITPDVTRALSADLCARLAEALGVARDRIYIEFADVQRHLWGYNGSTFG
jgi:phenylpyruvate tautomerase PptA (4-oxalocrotonate tautomerase family)